MANGEWCFIREHRPAMPTDLALREDHNNISPFRIELSYGIRKLLPSFTETIQYLYLC